MGKRYNVTPAVFVVVQDSPAREPEILLQRRMNTGFRDGEYDVASGHLERGESPLAGAVRELEEETGLVAKPEDLELFHIVMNETETPQKPYMYLFFRIAKADCVGDYVICEPDKCDNMGMFPLNNLPAVVPHVRTVLDNIKCKTVSFSQI